MDSLFISAAIVAVAEIGDKTQLLALVLAARFRRPIPIILGILLATLANHGLAAWVGLTAAAWLGSEVTRWILGLSFLAMAAWMLVPDKIDDDAASSRLADRLGPFLATLIAFFLVEIGDKTQIATIVLAARFNDLVLVTAGTTLGMMAANIPAVLIGDAAAKRLPLTLVHGIAAVLFAVLGVLVLSEAGAALIPPDGLVGG